MPATPIDLIVNPIQYATLVDDKAQKLKFSKNVSKVKLKVASSESHSLRIAHPRQALTEGTSKITASYFLLEPGEETDLDVRDLADIQMPTTNKGVAGGFLWVAADTVGVSFSAMAVTERVRS